MRRSPLFHISLGLIVAFGAGVSGILYHAAQDAPRHSSCRSAPDLTPLQTVPRTSGFFKCATDDEDGIIVKYRSSATKAGVATLLKRLHLREEASYQYLPGFSFEKVETGDVETVIAALKRDPNVEYVERNVVYHKDDTPPNDPDFSKQWGHFNNGQPINGGRSGKPGTDIGALSAWEITTGGSDIVVGVIDTGVDYSHVDLKENMWINDQEIPNNGKDDDGNGVVDDVYGYNAVANSGNPMDDNGHGTHCAGILGAEGDNGEGIAGVNWNVRIMALKFLSDSGSGRLNDALECVNYAVAMKKRGVNLRVLSNSWGGGGYSRALEDAIKRANDADILFVAAAGNDATDNDRHPHYPSSYNVPNVVAVAALNANDELASFSCYGAKSVHIAAPGSDIYSCVPGELFGESYMHFSGTSMATPYVSGAAALVLSAEPNLSVKQLKARLLDSAVRVDALRGKVATGGRLNVAEALRQ
jgi:subtilisin family serine protease